MGNRHALSIGEAGGDGDFRLILSGELDMDTAPRLESAFTRLCVQGAREIEIDLRGLTFIDTTGLRAIMTAKELCARSHSQFYVVEDERWAHRRVFELAGVYEQLPWRAVA